MKRLVAASFAALIIGGVGSAMAIPMGENFAVDFRTWNGAQGQDSYTDPVTGITAEALPTAVGPLGSYDYKLNHDPVDGLGIYWDNCFYDDADPDEIEGKYEKLSVTSAGFEANGIWITDLFGPDDGIDPILGEKGKVIINGGTDVFEFYGNEGNHPNGEVFVDFGKTLTISSAVFETIPTPRDKWWKDPYAENEYSVAGFTASVPEPATLLLLGTGIIGLAGLGVRRKR